MLTLRSAFASGDRARLMERILHVEPPRPRRVDPRIPRDLETIVLKAMAKEPGRRYAGASVLAEDLRRFLADRPIRARRTPAWEHAWRFCRRNPGLASSIAVAASLMAALVVAWAVWTARLDAELKRTGEARQAEQAARRDAQDKLWRSYLARAQAGRFGRRPGRRLDGLEALRQAIPIARAVDAPRSGFDELRDEAIACLALADLRPGKLAIDVPAGASSPVFDGMFRRYASFDRQGVVTVHTIGQSGPVVRIADVGGVPRELRLSPDGRSLAIVLPEGVQVREVEGGGLVWRLSGRVGQAEFAADSRRVAVGLADRTVVVADVAAGREVARFSVGFRPLPLAMRPDGKQLAVADESRDVGVEIWDLEPPRKVANLRPDEPGPIAALGWSPDGRRLGIGLVLAPIVEIWDVADRRQVVALEGHAQQVNVLRFHPDGDLILTGSWDGTARLWDAGTGRSVVHWQSLVDDPHFGRDGRACGVVKIGGEYRVLEVEPGREYRTLVAGVGVRPSGYFWADISPDDLLAVGMEDGVRLWDLGTGRELAFLPIGKSLTANFVTGKRGRELLSCGPGGLHRWPILEEAGTPGRLRIGTPRKVPLPADPTTVAVGSDGRLAVVACEGSGAVLVLDLEDEVVRCTLPHPSANFGRVSPDGRWVVTAGWHATSVKVWDARTGAPVNELATGRQNYAFFSPDGRTMITSLSGRYQFREVPSWRSVRELQWEIPSHPGWVAFSPDRKLVGAGAVARGGASRRGRFRPDAGPAAGSGRRPGGMAGLHGRRGEAGGDRGVFQDDPPVGPPGYRPGTRRPRPARRTGRVSPVRGARPDAGDPGRDGAGAGGCRGGAGPRRDRPVSEGGTRPGRTAPPSATAWPGPTSSRPSHCASRPRPWSSPRRPLAWSRTIPSTGTHSAWRVIARADFARRWKPCAPISTGKGTATSPGTFASWRWPTTASGRPTAPGNTGAGPFDGAATRRAFPPTSFTNCRPSARRWRRRSRG